MMRSFLSALFALALIWPVTALSIAVDPERLEDPVLEERARDLSRDVRCLVCQNQSIEDSNADLARDLRRIVRERIVAGDTDSEVLDYLVDRYGDWVLLSPPVKPETYALWAAPVILFLGGLTWISLFVMKRRTNRSNPAPLGPVSLSDEEKSRLDRILSEDTGEKGGN